MSDRAATTPRSSEFALLCAAVGLEAVGIGMIYPLLAHIQSIHHLPTYALGLMSGGNFFAALIAQLGVSRLLDGRRARRVLLTGVLIGSLSLLWFALAGDLWQLVASRAAGGVGFGIVGPAALRAASIGVEGEARGSRLGTLSSAMMGGIVLGPLSASLLFAVGGVPLPFEVVAGLLLVVFVAVLASPGSHTAPDGPADGRTGLAGLPVRPVIALLLLATAAQLPTGLYDALWSRLLTDRGASELLIGISLSLFGLPLVVLSRLGGRIAERRGPLLAAGIGLLVADGFMASYGFVPSPIVITLLGVAEACVQSVAIPGAYAAVARVFPDDRAATGQGVFSGAGTAAAGAGAVVGAPVFAALGPGAVFAGGAGISAALVCSCLLVSRGRLATGPGAPPGADGPGGPVGPAVPGVPAVPTTP